MADASCTKKPIDSIDPNDQPIELDYEERSKEAVDADNAANELRRAFLAIPPNLSDSRQATRNVDDGGNNAADLEAGINPEQARAGDKRPADTSEDVPPQIVAYPLDIIPTTEDERKWELPEDLANYFETHARKFASKSQIRTYLDGLKCHPPTNIVAPPVLDPAVATLLMNKVNGGKVKSQDKELQESFTKAAAVMGPLGRAWVSVQEYA